MRYLSIPALICYLLFPLALRAQQVVRPDESSCDCKGRIILTDSIVHAVNSPPGGGMISEIRSSSMNPYAFEMEHNTVWYEFTAPRTAWLELRITPESPKDDYDFMLFEMLSPSACDSIQAGTLLPLRSVISRNDLGISGITGLSDTAIETHIPQGIGPAFATVSKVSRGAKYILVLDNVYPGGKGHVLELRYLPAPEEPAVAQPPFTLLSLSITDSSSAPLQAAVFIKLRYPKPGERAVLLDTVSNSVTLKLDASSFYSISVNKEGYLAYSENLNTRSGNDKIVRKIKLDSMLIGKAFLFDQVYFRGGSDQFMPGAQDALKQIHQMLKDNPSIQVEIQGHVNQPYNLISRMSAGESKQLSVSRAKAVHDYLLRKGIDPSRLSYQGYGNSRMLFPYAKDEEEMRMNRRVEVVITGIITQ